MCMMVLTERVKIDNDFIITIYEVGVVFFFFAYVLFICNSYTILISL